MPVVPRIAREALPPSQRNNPKHRPELTVDNTTPFQQGAAMRAKGMFEEQRYSDSFRQRFNAGLNPATSRTPEMDNLEQALKLADEIDKANAVKFYRYSEEQKAEWRKALTEGK